MPSPTQHPAARILDYFRTAPLDQAMLVFGLVSAAMTERRSRSVQQKQIASQRLAAPMATPVHAAPVARTAKPKKKVKAKPRNGSTARRVAPPALPAPSETPGMYDAADN